MKAIPTDLTAGFIHHEMGPSGPQVVEIEGPAAGFASGLALAQKMRFGTATPIVDRTGVHWARCIHQRPIGFSIDFDLSSVSDTLVEGCIVRDAAIHRHCRDTGRTTGFGPVEIGPAEARVVCTAWGEVVSTSFTALAGHHAPCDGVTERKGPNCNAAIHRFCGARGAATGFGPVENAGDGAAVVCLRR